MNIRDMPNPTVRLWRRVSELRDKRRKQSEELQALYKSAEAVRDNEDQFAARLEQAESKMEVYRKEVFETKISIVAEAFGIKDTDSLEISDIAYIYSEIESTVMEKMVTKSKELPNAETPASQS